MPKIKVGVLRGGPSSEYDVSLRTGENVLKYLPSNYEGIDILIDKAGNWHFDGIKKPYHKIFPYIDIAFIAMHGEFGEDGKVQQILEQFKVPFTGSGSMASACSMNKFLARKIFEGAGLKIPKGFLIKNETDAKEIAKLIFKKFSPPWVLKPVGKGSSVGVKIVSNFNDLKNSVESAFYENGDILFEEYIKGKEATCGVLENFRGEKYYALPPVEIIPPDKNIFFDYVAKYSGETQEICPANFTDDIKNEIQYLAKAAHSALGCRGYSRSDFIVSPRGIFLLELNNLPGLTSESLLPKSAVAVGISFSDLLDHLIKISLAYGHHI